ncbi:hypothetical protein ACWFRQ_38195 [Streptomyces niveus]
MATTPDRDAEICDRPHVDLVRQIADLRAVIRTTVPLLGFSAGQIAADNPEYAERLMSAGAEAEAVLRRTAPESPG